MQSTDDRAPFFLGVAGLLRLSSSNDSSSNLSVEQELRERVWAILDWLRSGRGAGTTGGLNPQSGRFDKAMNCDRLLGTCENEEWWAPHGLEATPIVVLSNLAPGVDTVVAEAALDYAAEVEGALVTVRGPLPFPVEVYRQSSSFQDRDPEQAQAHLERFDRLVHRIKLQAGFVEDRDLFCVELHPDVDSGDPVGDLIALEDGDPERKRRWLRYRAAGEYLAVACHMLLAAHDTESGGSTSEAPIDRRYQAGTSAAIETMRSGASPGLIEDADDLSWANNGPVLLLPLKRTASGAILGAAPMSFLYPYDTYAEQAATPSVEDRLRHILGRDHHGSKPASSRPQEPNDQEPGWQQAGHDLLRRTLRNQESFNQVLMAGASQAGAVQLLRPHKSDVWAEVDLSDEARAHAEGLDAMARTRAKASQNANEFDVLRKKLQVQLAWLVLLAASALGMYEHWHYSIPGHGAESAHAHWYPSTRYDLFEVALLLVVIGTLVRSAFLFWRYIRSGAESTRFDHRAISEGLRVQFYWNLAGIGRSVGSEYMQRQRDELSWIRGLLGSLASPTVAWRHRFDRLSTQAKGQILHATRIAWVRGQFHYTHAKAQDCEHAAHTWHGRGWILACAGVLNIFGKFLGELIGPVHHLLLHSPFLVVCGLVALALAALCTHLVIEVKGQSRSLAEHKAASRHGLFAWLFARPLLWGRALFVAALAFALSHLTRDLLHGLHWGGPTQHGWWIIVTGSLLLAAALCMAWSERRFYSEDARKNRSLRSLYDSADRRLETLIKQFEQLEQATDPKAMQKRKRILAEAQHILHQLGSEALDETAEWLILHRARPLEPFMAG